MFARILLLALSAASLSACVPVFEASAPHEQLTFDFAPPSQAPVNYADMLCCFDCTV